MKYTKKDFFLEEVKINQAEGYKDYYFSIPEELKKEIVDKNMKQGMITMDKLIYCNCNTEDTLIGQFVFIFNLAYYKIEGFEEIKYLLKEIIEEMEE